MPPTTMDTDHLEQRIRELQERLKQSKQRDRSTKELAAWLKTRSLTYLDLLFFYRELKPKREAEPVKSRKPLRPPTPSTPGKGKAYGNRRGDIEFQRGIKKARVDKGMTLNQFGEKIGFSGATISAWENGYYIPREETRLKLVKALGLPETLGQEVSLQNERDHFMKKGANGEGASP